MSQGLIALWRCQEKSGNLISVIGGNTLVASNLTYSQSGMISSAVGFNGTSSQANVPVGSQTNLDIPINEDRTWAFRFKTTAPSAASGVNIIDKRTLTGVTPANILTLSVFQTKLRASIFINGVTTAGGALQGNTTVNDGVWHTGIVTFTRAVAGLRMYVDNFEQSASPKDSSALIAYSLAQPFYIGRGGSTTPGPAANFFPGSIEEIAIWNRIITADERARFQSKNLIPEIPVDVKSGINPTSSKFNTFKDINEQR